MCVVHLWLMGDHPTMDRSLSLDDDDDEWGEREFVDGRRSTKKSKYDEFPFRFNLPRQCS